MDRLGPIQGDAADVVFDAGDDFKFDQFNLLGRGPTEPPLVRPLLFWPRKLLAPRPWFNIRTGPNREGHCVSRLKTLAARPCVPEAPQNITSKIAFCRKLTLHTAGNNAIARRRLTRNFSLQGAAGARRQFGQRHPGPPQCGPMSWRALGLRRSLGRRFLEWQNKRHHHRKQHGPPPFVSPP
ncbi:hypothetical protein D3C80_1425630 [compost metagenome]